jgi:drug/metabolite transporter (DMT)-like permease
MLRFRESGLAWMVLAQLLFAGMNICTRLGSIRVPWPEVASARFLLGALLAAGVGAARGTSLQIIDQPGAWRRSIFGALSAVGAFYALSSQRIAIGDAATLTSTAPIFVALLSGALLDEPVGRRVWVAVVLGFSGVLALVRPSFTLALPVALIATAGSFFYALAMIWLRKIGPAESHEAVVLHFSLVAFGVMLLLALPQWRWPDARSDLFLLGAGLGGGGAQLAMTRAYSLHRAAPVTAISSLGVVFTYLLAAAAFAEQPTEWQVGGALLVIAAGVVVSLRRA